MRISESCAKCLYDRQKEKTDNEEYLAEVKKIIDERGENDTSPYLVYLFNETHEKIFGKCADYKAIKKKYNDLVLGMEDELRNKIEESSDPLAKSLIVSRIGNYIDFAALNDVNTDTFLKLFNNTDMREDEKEAYVSFCNQCAKAKTFLLLTDNCGEIVLDKLMIEQIKKRFPNLSVTVMVRGGEVSNDATIEDAMYTGMDSVATVITNGKKIAGTVYSLLSDEAKGVVDNADVILSKGQANYESFAGEGRHAFYSLLCKCELFMNRFHVPQLTGIFVEEAG